MRPLCLWLVALPLFGALKIVTTSLPNGQVGIPYFQFLSAQGSTGGVNWSLDSGALPAGLSLNPAGVIGGTPRAVGTADFTVRASNESEMVNRSFSIQIVAAPVISTVSLPSGQVGTAYSQSVIATGGSLPYTWSIAS